ncbi:hypothetical protein BJY01DRAFT_70938 [Aspergillus pseudoustus]|uniref:Uncharacterized protein n=1 Tax=Aspergillus pseudoustus TaxID=1810923 RepID=A0ABR4L0G4_9EURO
MRLQHGVTASVLGRLQPWTFNRRSWGRPNIHQSESFQESGRVPSGYLDHTNFKHVLTCRSARANGLTFPSFEVFASYRPRSEGCNQFIG